MYSYGFKCPLSFQNIVKKQYEGYTLQELAGTFNIFNEIVDSLIGETYNFLQIS